jgi:hypothetical protein
MRNFSINTSVYLYSVIVCTYFDLMKTPKRRRKIQSFYFLNRYRVEIGYKDIGLGDTAPIVSDVLTYQLVPPKHNKELYTQPPKLLCNFYSKKR